MRIAIKDPALRHLNHYVGTSTGAVKFVAGYAETVEKRARELIDLGFAIPAEEAEGEVIPEAAAVQESPEPETGSMTGALIEMKTGQRRKARN